MFVTKRCPLGGTEYVSFELFLGILSGPGEGRGDAPGTVPLQNPEVTSRKACLRNAEKSIVSIRVCDHCLRDHLAQYVFCIVAAMRIKPWQKHVCLTNSTSRYEPITVNRNGDCSAYGGCPRQ